MTASIGTSLARVTVAAPGRRIDLALPDDISLGGLLPEVLRHAGEHAADDGQAHGGWVLRRTSGALLEPTATLAALGVRDGEMLHLTPRRAEWPEPEFDDIAEAIASGARRRGRTWGAGATRRSAIAVSSAAFVFGLVNVAAATPPASPEAGLALVLALVLAAAGITLSRAMGDAVAGAAVAACAAPYAFAGGALALTPAPDSLDSLVDLGAPHLLAGSVALLGIGVIGYVGVAALSRLFVAAVGIGLLGMLAGLVGLGSMPAAGVAGIVLTVAIGFMSGYPLLSFRIGRLPLPTVPQRAEEILDDAPSPTRLEIFDAVARSDEVLTGLLLAVGVVSPFCVVPLVRAGGVVAPALAVVASLALLLRARLFPAPRQRVPLLASGVAGLAAWMAVVSLAASSPGARALLQVVVALAAAGVLAAGLLYSRRPPSPYLGRFADIADVLLIAALVPLACAPAGFYGYVRGLFASIGS
jgi:type VII secretion integral membrane protein EccD